MATRRIWRYGLLGLGALVVLIVAAGAVFLARFDPNSLKPQIIAAVQQATGRQLTLNGPISLKVSLRPTVELRDVALANPPGFSGPDMAKLQRLDLRLAVLPLLHHAIVIERLILVHPDIMLEVNAQGKPNWDLTPATTPGAPTPPTPPAATTSKGTTTTISARYVRIEDGMLTWHDDVDGSSLTLSLQRLTAAATSPDAPMKLAMQAAYNGTPFTLDGQIGALGRLQQPDATSPWPVKLTLAVAGATLGVDGSLTHPLQGRGYKLAVNGDIPDLTKFAPLLPGIHLPPLHDVRIATQLADNGTPVPQVEQATLHLGQADLGSYVPGLSLTSADIIAPPQNQPVQINVQASRNSVPLSLVASVGASTAMLSADKRDVPVPVDVTLRAGNANLTVKGSIAHPETLSGADLLINAAVPDLGALAPVAAQPLPGVKNIAFQAHLTDGPGGLAHSATLQTMTLTTLNGDLSGTISVSSGPPRVIDGKLHANRIDADALLAALGKPVPAPPPQAAPGAPAAAPTPPPPPHAAPPPHPTAGARRLFPNTPIPFGALRLANADVALTVDDLRSGGLDYRNIAVHVVLQDGKLHVDPIAADLPEGKLTASLSVDATVPAPAVALTVHAPGLAVTPLLAAAGLPGYASGKLEIYADLHGAGISPHAIASGLDGSLGLAMQNGTIDTALLNNFLGTILGKVNLLSLLSGGGSGKLECFALRTDAHHGIADVRALALVSSLLTMDGTGSVNLANETLDLRLRPQGRVAGTGLVIPMGVTGSIISPEVKVNAIGAATADVGSVAGAVVGTATPLGLLGGALGAGNLLNTAPNVTCAGPLALARGQAAPAAAPAAHPKANGPAGALRNLFR